MILGFKTYTGEECLLNTDEIACAIKDEKYTLVYFKSGKDISLEPRAYDLIISLFAHEHLYP